MVEYYRATDWRTRAESLGHSLGVIVAAFLVGYVLLNVVALVLVGVGAVSVEALTSDAVPVPPVAYVVITVAQFGGFVLIAGAYLVWRDAFDLFSVDVPDLRDLGGVVGGTVALFVAAIAVSFVIQQLGVQTATNQAVELGQQNPALFLYMIPITILVVAPAEELLFRGVVQGLFRRAYGVVPAVVFASPRERLRTHREPRRPRRHPRPLERLRLRLAVPRRHRCCWRLMVFLTSISR
ncbi:CPBP family intramembrane metalloprotease [Halobacteriales archaeon QH_8_68_33]|nr:MAG: CPBP family intramembrane metalloprotease [Halobacteriales archaeon QH_8_68_33]